MALTDVAVRNAKPREKPYKLGDAGGLFLLVQPSGGKLWRLKYRIDGREKKLALGTYPAVSLADARTRRDDAKRLIEAGADPSIEKARRKAQSQEVRSNTFAAVAEDFIAKRLADGDKRWSERTEAKQRRFLSRLLPFIGKLPISDITPPEILAAVKRIEATGKHESARRAVQLAGMIFRYGIQTGRAVSDPTRDLRGALIAPTTTHRAAITDAVNVGALLRAIDGYSGNAATLYALKMIPHVFVRPGELRQAEWAEFDFDNAVWILPAAKMKMKRPHAVPLSRQVIALLEEWQQFRGRDAGFVFPSIRSTARPISDGTLNAALRRLGYGSNEMSAHGFRAMASTLLNEAVDPATKKALWTPDAIERALAHGHEDKVRGAYHRGSHWDERVRMSAWWSDYLDQLRRGADVIELRRRKK
ncbi:MAG TPA: integrase arm-type DNA-binding domain-containing protein [Sphingobium sp.]|nr:integrase arm-type DNA-binding domain-containing protein [Sphingobium sp.]